MHQVDMPFTQEGLVPDILFVLGPSYTVCRTVYAVRCTM